MADSRRWNASGVRRDDQFVRPPAFRDEHESDHLSTASAHWHGSGSRQVALAAVLAIAAGVAAVGLMFAVSPDGADLGSQSPVGAQGDGGPLDGSIADGASMPDGSPIDVGDVQVPAPGAIGNGTAVPLPTMPVP